MVTLTLNPKLGCKKSTGWRVQQQQPVSWFKEQQLVSWFKEEQGVEGSKTAAGLRV
jgi:hypothetical protein